MLPYESNFGVHFSHVKEMRSQGISNLSRCLLLTCSHMTSKSPTVASGCLLVTLGSVRIAVQQLAQSGQPSVVTPPCFLSVFSLLCLDE